MLALMFWWFQRNSEYIRHEVRKAANGYELVVLLSDGTERIERFRDQTVLEDRRAALVRALADDGWTGPHDGGSR
jgi:hypothetical protein